MCRYQCPRWGEGTVAPSAGLAGGNAEGQAGLSRSWGEAKILGSCFRRKDTVWFLLSREGHIGRPCPERGEADKKEAPGGRFPGASGLN